MKVQSILEKSCYAFATIKLNHVLSHKAWDCPEAGELNVWTKVLWEYELERHVFDQSIATSLRKPTLDLLRDVAQLRHDTVHRVRLTADKLLEYLESAKLFVMLLGDHAALKILSKIQRHLVSTVAEMKRNKKMIE